MGIALRPCADAPYMRRFAVSVRVSTAVNDERGWLVRPARLHMRLARYLFRWIEGSARSQADRPTKLPADRNRDDFFPGGLHPSLSRCPVARPRLPRSASSFSSERSYAQAQPGSNCGKIPRPSPVLGLASRSELGPVSTLFRVLHRVQATADQAGNRPGLQTGRLATCKPFVINNSKGRGQGILPKMRGEKAGL